jgi:hypothetical protein
MASYKIENAPTELDVQSFRSVAYKYGSLAKTCRFVVQIIPPLSIRQNERIKVDPKDFTYLCEATEFPGRAFNSADIRYYGPSFKLPYQPVYEDINMTFLCREQSLEREFFDDWMELINPTNTFNFNYRDNYSTSIKLFQFADWPEFADDTGPKVTYAFTLEYAYPTIINSQPVTWADDQFQRLTVSFTYFKWYREGKDLSSTQTNQNQLVIGSNVIPV